MVDTKHYFSEEAYQLSKDASKYRSSGFTTLQAVIHAGLYALRAPALSPALNLTTQAFPLRKYEYDGSASTTATIGPMYFVIGFFPVVQKLVGLLVLEKERRTKEGEPFPCLTCLALLIVRSSPSGLIQSTLSTAFAHWLNRTVASLANASCLLRNEDDGPDECGRSLLPALRAATCHSLTS